MSSEHRSAVEAPAPALRDREARGEPNLIAELVTVAVPIGWRVLIAGDLHFSRYSTTTSRASADELSGVLDAWAGPGVVVLAGDTFELLGDNCEDPGPALDAHPHLNASLQRWTAQSHRVLVVLAGTNDAALAWHEPAVMTLERRFRAQVALCAELSVETGSRTRRIRVEHGHRLDPLVRDVVPAVNDGRTPWIEGLASLADSADAPVFVASRIAYRKVARHLWWLALPFLAVVALRVGLLAADVADNYAATRFLTGWAHHFTELTLAVVADVALMAAVLGVAAREAFRAVNQLVGPRGPGRNDRARNEADRLATEGVTGYITGDSHRPELADLGDRFYANVGCGTDVREQTPARLGLPPVFCSFRRLSWLELEAGAELHTRLVVSEAATPGMTRLERIAMRPRHLEGPTPTIVGSLPGRGDYPPHVDPLDSCRRPRRIAASAIMVVALLDVLSSVTPPLRHRLHWITQIVPLAVPETATALTVVMGLGLLALAAGVRRGQRRAWTIATALVALSMVTQVTKGLDLEEASVAAVTLLYLLAHRRAFQARTDASFLVRAMATATVGAALALVVAIGVLITGDNDLSLGRAGAAVAERLVGLTITPIPGMRGRFLTPALAAVGVALAALVARALFRPVRRQVHARSRGHLDGLTRARSIVAQHGAGTLDYFALRSDKEFFFHGESLVAYAVHNGVALVSPDPIGPAAERKAVWSSFREFADRRGWSVAVMAASERWLDIYRAAGMHDVYIGDEAVVDTRRFSLDGGRHKGLRQAVNRIARHGYRIEFHDPVTIDATLADALRALMIESRRGNVERGFSMTLGRIFDGDDHGLLLAVAFGPNGAPVAFCQFVPAPGINGYSLDLIRRSTGEHPNGLTDFVIVETLRELGRREKTGLALNFATVRAVLAGEAGQGLTTRLERWLASQMSEDMQIESLWRYNAKFDPDWRPRYAVFDAPEHLPAAAFAVARAESFWELPVIGRFLQPKGEREAAVSSTAASQEREPQPGAVP